MNLVKDYQRRRDVYVDSLRAGVQWKALSMAPLLELMAGHLLKKNLGDRRVLQKELAHYVSARKMFSEATVN